MNLVSDHPIPTYGMNGKTFKLQLSFTEYYGYICPNKSETVDAIWDSVNECFFESKTNKEIFTECIVAWEIK